jgi:foldase protein PrsA
MTRMTRPVVIACAAVLALAVLGATACTQTDKNIVATVNGAPIMKQAIDTQIAQMKTSSPGSFVGTAGVALEKEYRGRILDSLIEIQLVEEAGKKLGVTVTDAAVNTYLKTLETQYGGKSGLDAAMKQSGIDMAGLKTSIHNRLLVEGVTKKAGGTVNVTEAQMKAYYDANKTQFTAPIEVRVQHILLASKDQKLAQSLLARVKKGENFAALAKKYTTDPGSKTTGGVYDWAPSSKYVPEFGGAAEKMKIGEVRLVQSQFGWHVLQLLGRRGGKLQTYDQVKAQIKTTLESQGQATNFAKYVADLRKKAKIEILDAALKKVVDSQSSAVPAQ